MDNAQSNHPEQPPVDTQAGQAGTVRDLFDMRGVPEGRPGSGAGCLIHVILFALGGVIGGILLRIIDKDSVGNVWLVGGLISNAYLWACLIATPLYALHDRRARRRRPKTD